MAKRWLTLLAAVERAYWQSLLTERESETLKEMAYPETDHCEVKSC